MVTQFTNENLKVPIDIKLNKKMARPKKLLIPTPTGELGEVKTKKQLICLEQI